MRDQPVDIPFPFSGLNEFPAYDDQAQGTSVDMQNVVPVDPRSGRLRGAQRPGIEKFNKDQAINNGAAIQELIHSIGPRFTQVSGSAQQVTNNPSAASWGLIDRQGAESVSGGHSQEQLQLSVFDPAGNLYIGTRRTTLSETVEIAKYDRDGKYTGFLSDTASLTAAMSETTTQITVDSGAQTFPAVPFAISISSPGRSQTEYAWVTSKSAGTDAVTFDILRGSDIARTHDAGVTASDTVEVSDTSISYGAGDDEPSFPHEGKFLLLLSGGGNSELVVVTSHDTATRTLTVQRGALGTTAQVYSSPPTLNISFADQGTIPSNESWLSGYTDDDKISHASGSTVHLASRISITHNVSTNDPPPLAGMQVVGSSLFVLVDGADSTFDARNKLFRFNSFSGTCVDGETSDGPNPFVESASIGGDSASQAIGSIIRTDMPGGSTFNNTRKHRHNQLAATSDALVWFATVDVSSKPTLVINAINPQTGQNYRTHSTTAATFATNCKVAEITNTAAESQWQIYSVLSDGDTGVFVSAQSQAGIDTYARKIFYIAAKPPSSSVGVESPVVADGDTELLDDTAAAVTVDVTTDGGGQSFTLDSSIEHWVQPGTRVSYGSTHTHITAITSSTELTVADSGGPANEATVTFYRNMSMARDLAYDPAGKTASSNNNHRHLAMVGSDPMSTGGSTANTVVVIEVRNIDVDGAATVSGDKVHRSSPDDGNSSAVPVWHRVSATNKTHEYILIRETGSAKVQSISVGNEARSVTVTTDDSISSGVSANWTATTSNAEQDLALAVSITFENRSDINRSRDVRLLSISGGLVYRIDPISKAVELVAGQAGGPRLSVNRPQLFAAESYPDIYFADENVAVRYNSSTDQIEDWVATSGDVPSSDNKRCRLINSWADRIVLAGLEPSPSSWFMSAIGNPLDFDVSAGLETSAVAGAGSPIGETADIITSLVPWNNDVLLFGMDHSISALSGNPAGGGRFDLLTEITGMAFGRPYAFHPDRSLWFIGSRGGLYRMSGVGAQIERISSTTLDDRLSNVAFDTTIVRMTWDDRLQGFLIFLTSVEGGSDDQHYFYDTRTQGFFPWKFANTSHSPAVIHAFDGDKPDDRTILMGCPDGFIRNLDYDGPSDDGTAISSHVMIGPIKGEAIPLVMTGLTSVLGAGSSNVTYSIHPGDSAEEASSAASIGGGTFTSGRNTWDRRRTSGAAIFIKLSNATLGETWAIERLTATLRTTSRTFEKAH